MSYHDGLVEASRRALLRYYNSQTMTHGGYIITVVVGFLALISQWKTFAGSLISWNVIFLFIISLLASLGIHLFERIMYWGYLSNGVLRAKLGAKSEETIMLQLHEKTGNYVRDNHPKTNYFRKLRPKFIIGATIIFWGFLNLLHYCLVELKMSLSIYQIFGWILLIFLMIFVVILSRPVRRKIKETYHLGKGWKRKIAKLYENYLYLLVIIRHGLLFLTPIAFFSIVDFSIVSKHSFSLILLGLSFVVFVSIQLPQLMKAHIRVTFTIKGKGTDSPIVFKSGKEILVEGNLYNLGFSTYKNFTVIFYFGEDFEIVPCDNAKYQVLSFKKKFSIQKRHGGVFFSPKDNSLIIPPQEVFIFPMYIKAPKKEKVSKVTVEFYSENTWGMTMIDKRVIVER